MTLAGLFELAGKVTFAERRRVFYKKELRKERKEMKKLEAQLHRKRASAEARKAKLGEWKTEIETLSPELDAHSRAVGWAGGLPDALWERITGLLDEEEAAFPFALTCRRFREIQKRVSSAQGKKQLCSNVVCVDEVSGD